MAGINHRISPLGLALAMWVSVTAGAAPGKAELKLQPPDSVQLDPITVHPYPNPLDDSLNRLRRMLDASSPCLGCDSIPVRENLVERVVHAIPEMFVPPNPDFEERREDRVNNDWQKLDWAPFMEDFR